MKYLALIAAVLAVALTGARAEAGGCGVAQAIAVPQHQIVQAIQVQHAQAVVAPVVAQVVVPTVQTIQVQPVVQAVHVQPVVVQQVQAVQHVQAVQVQHVQAVRQQVVQQNVIQRVEAGGGNRGRQIQVGLINRGSGGNALQLGLFNRNTGR